MPPCGQIGAAEAVVRTLLKGQMAAQEATTTDPSHDRTVRQRTRGALGICPRALRKRGDLVLRHVAGHDHQWDVELANPFAGQCGDQRPWTVTSGGRA